MIREIGKRRTVYKTPHKSTNSSVIPFVLFVSLLLCLFVALLVPQRYERVDFGGAAGGDVAGEEGRQTEQY